jgi:CheY-like chemotaxis protein
VTTSQESRPWTDEHVSSNSPPSILVADNRLGQLSTLMDLLERHGFSLTPVSSRQDALRALESNIFDLALLDVSFTDVVGEAEGLILAQDIARRAPETPVVFISRPEFINVEIVLKMFNLDEETRGSRLAEAYVNKYEPDRVLETCRAVLTSSGCVAPVAPIRVDEESWRSIETQLTKKVGADFKQRSEPLVTPVRQFVQILRRITFHHCMRLREVRVQSVSRGRSRTVVVVATSTYKPTDAEHHIVIKIGTTEMLKIERDNYLQWIQSFVQCGSYPTLTTFVTSRQLAGIAYSMVKSEGEPAPTFTDRFWEMSEEQSRAVLARVFGDMLLTHDRALIARARTLQQEYRDRFRALKNTQQLELNLASICDSVKIGRASGSRWEFLIGREWVRTRNPLQAIPEDFFDPYVEAVVHGDLHTDNVIVPQDRTFLIDFAHTGPHHVFLDYVTMEVSVRYYLLRQLLERPGSDVEAQSRRWLELEIALARLDPIQMFSVTASDLGDDVPPELARLMNVIIWLRHSAFVRGYRDSYRNYFAAVGMASITLPLLPDESSKPVRHAIRRTILLTASLALDKAAELKTEAIGAGLSASQRDHFMAAVASSAETKLRTGVRQELQSWVGRSKMDLRIPQDVLDSIAGWLQSVENEWPLLSRAIRTAHEHLGVVPGLERSQAPIILPTLFLWRFGDELSDEIVDLRNATSRMATEIRRCWRGDSGAEN